MINYIIKALLNDDSISVNDLGVFKKHYQSARFEGDTMLPPQYIVTLEIPEDQPDGTALINLICHEKQCRITEASSEIIRWVEELKTALENNKSVSFDNFGTFSLTDKGSIRFVCDRISDLNREFEGMGIVRLGEGGEMGTDGEMGEKVNGVQEVQGVQGVQEVQEVNEVNEVEDRRLQEEAMKRLKEAEEQERLAKEAEEKRLQEEAEQRLREAEEQERLAKEAEEKRLQEEAEQRLKEAEEQERLAKEAKEIEKVNEEEEKEGEKEVTKTEEEERDVENDKYPKKHRNHWWLFILIILISLGVLGYLFRQQLLIAFNYLKERISAPKEAVITEEPETAAEDTATYEEEITIAEDTVVEPEVYTPEVVRNTASGNYPVIRFESGHFYVIAGSLPNEQDAVRHIRQRNLDQFEPKIVMQPGANLRVCIGIFDTEEEAVTFAKNINPKYWVLK